jgi:hypothetical protein
MWLQPGVWQGASGQGLEELTSDSNSEQHGGRNGYRVDGLDDGGQSGGGQRGRRCEEPDEGRAVVTR